MALEELDCVVVGAGVIGLAVARALAFAGREVVILESADAIGTEISSRKSEVIHAGIDIRLEVLWHGFALRDATPSMPIAASAAYAPQMRQAHRRDIDGRAWATSSNCARAATNGVSDLRRLSATEAMALEPALATTGALFSPSTGIIDSHAYMLTLLGDAQNSVRHWFSTARFWEEN